MAHDPDPVRELTESLGESAAGLDELEGLPVGEHIERYDELHAQLQDALSSIDEF